MVNYLDTPIAEKQQTAMVPGYGMTQDGYTKRSGAPTSYMIRLQGEKRWRRVMCWQFSNTGTLFIRTKNGPLVVRECDL